MRLASSAAGISATSLFGRRRRTITTSWSSATRSRTEASLARKSVYVVSTGTALPQLYIVQYSCTLLSWLLLVFHPVRIPHYWILDRHGQALYITLYIFQKPITST